MRIALPQRLRENLTSRPVERFFKTDDVVIQLPETGGEAAARRVFSGLWKVKAGIIQMFQVRISEPSGRPGAPVARQRAAPEERAAK